MVIMGPTKTPFINKVNGNVRLSNISSTIAHLLQSSRPTEVLRYDSTEEAPLCDANDTFGNNTNCTVAPYRDSDLAKAEVIVLAITFTLAVLGNGCVIVVLLPRWKKLARVHHFMLNLSIADFLVAFWTIFEQLLEDLSYNGLLTVGGDPLCRFLRFMQVFPVYGSSYILVMCAIDRFIAICYPLKNYSWTNKRTYMLVALAWTISFLMASPQFFLFSSEYDENMKIQKCNHAWDRLPAWSVAAYTFYYIGFTFFIPLIVLIVTYGCISYTVWVNVHSKIKTNNNKKNGVSKANTGNISVISQDSTPGRSVAQPSTKTNDVMPRTHSKRAFSRAKLKTVALTFVVVCAFILCWTPYSFMMAWWGIDESIAYRPDIGASLTIMPLLTYVNSCVNPYIYMFFNYKIIKKFLYCREKRPRTFMDRRRLANSDSVSSQTRTSIVSDSSL